MTDSELDSLFEQTMWFTLASHFKSDTHRHTTLHHTVTLQPHSRHSSPAVLVCSDGPCGLWCRLLAVRSISATWSMQCSGWSSTISGRSD